MTYQTDQLLDVTARLHHARGLVEWLAASMERPMSETYPSKQSLNGIMKAINALVVCLDVEGAKATIVEIVMRSKQEDEDD